jgi:hypothetical protein
MADAAGDYDEDDFDSEVKRMVAALGAVITRNEVVGLPSTIVALRRVLDANAAVYDVLVAEWRQMN